MKRILAIILTLALVVAIAYAEPRTIDLETMSVEELTTLANDVQAAIVNASVENIDGYNVVSDYAEYARNPDPHVGEMLRFNGKVVQVIEGDLINTYRIAYNGNSDNIFYVTYEISDSAQHILEDDKVTVFGEFEGLYTYTSTLGGQITVPYIEADSIVEEIVEEAEYPATRQDPAPIGAKIRYNGENYKNKCVTDITIMSVVRGDAAFKQAKAAYKWKSKPDAGKEYIIVTVKTAAISSENDAQATIDDYDFVFVSSNGVEYAREYCSGLQPELTNIYPGAENTGLVFGMVDKDEPVCLVYLKSSDNPIWFDLSKRVPIELPEDKVLTTLQKGDKNDDVKEMQLMLVEMGYLNTTADGDYGAKTQKAVAAYQKDMGLEETGIADVETLRYILTGTTPDMK